MKNNNWKIYLAIVIACVWGFTTFAQIAPARLQQFILDDKNISNADIKYALEVKGFYAHLHYKMAWLQKENTSNLNIFLNSLKLSSSIGLREKDYQFNYIGLFGNGAAHLQNADDSLEAEIRFTDAAIHFYNDIAYGNVKPALSYNGLKDVLGCYNIAALLAENISKNSLQLLLIHLSSTLPEINALENKIKWFNTVMADSDFKEATITSNKTNAANKPLISKLYQLGIIDTANKNLSENTIKQKIKEAQQQFNLLADGVLRTTIIQELNVPLAARLQQLSLSINYYRWLHCLMQNQSVIVVNIPAACLKVYRNSISTAR